MEVELPGGADVAVDNWAGSAEWTIYGQPMFRYVRARSGDEAAAKAQALWPQEE